MGLPSRRSWPTGLPVRGRVAEGPEDVVAELERLAQRVAVSRQGAGEVAEPARQRRPDVQRPLDRVLARLVAGDAAGAGPVAVGPGGAQQVEVLPHVELEAQVVPDGPHVGRRVAQQDVGVDVRHVADEDGGPLAEAPVLAAPPGGPVGVGERQVGRAGAPPGGRAVHHVVVDEGERVQHLERRADVDDLRVVGIAARGHEAPVAEGGAQPLAARVHQVAQGLERLDEGGVDGAPPGRLGIQQVAQAPVDAGGDGAEREGSGGAWAHEHAHVTGLRRRGSHSWCRTGRAARAPPVSPAPPPSRRRRRARGAPPRCWSRRRACR